MTTPERIARIKRPHTMHHYAQPVTNQEDMTMSNHTLANPDTIDGMLEIGGVYAITPADSTMSRLTREPVAIVSRRDDLYAPEAWYESSDPHDVGTHTGWTPVHGYSGQHASGATALMHPSEYVGGSMARDILSDGGTYAVVEVIDLDEMDMDAMPVGWTLVRWDGPVDSDSDSVDSDSVAPAPAPRPTSRGGGDRP